MPNSETVHGESFLITGNIPGEVPCFVISCNRGEIANDTLRAAKEVMHPPVFTASLHTVGDGQLRVLVLKDRSDTTLNLPLGHTCSQQIELFESSLSRYEKFKSDMDYAVYGTGDEFHID